MSGQQLSRQLHQRLRSQQIICASLAFSVVFYVGVAVALVATGFLEPLFQPSTEFQALGAGAGVVIVLLATPAARSIRGRAEALRPRDPIRLLDAFQRSTLVGSLVREAGAVIGFLVTVLTGNVVWVVVTAVVALIAMALAWPRRRDAEEWVLGGHQGTRAPV